MKRAIFIAMMLAAVAAWAIDGSTPHQEGVAFSVDHHTAEGQTFAQDSFKGRSAEDFLMPDGRFDLKAIRESGYQGLLDLKGFDVGTDPHTGEPILSPSLLHRDFVVPMPQRQDNNILTQQRTGEPVLAPANAKISSHPDDTFWTDNFSCIAGLDGDCYALCAYDGKLIAAGEFQIAGCTWAANIAYWDGSYWSPLGSGINGDVSALTVYDNKLIVGGWFTTAGGHECQ